ncbi:hypothetical protein [Longimicrobium sp.]|jgi:hypothetical protein
MPIPWPASANLQRIAAVMVRGRWVPREEIQAGLRAIEARNAS